MFPHVEETYVDPNNSIYQFALKNKEEEEKDKTLHLKKDANDNTKNKQNNTENSDGNKYGVVRQGGVISDDSKHTENYYGSEDQVDDKQRTYYEYGKHDEYDKDSKVEQYDKYDRYDKNSNYYDDKHERSRGATVAPSISRGDKRKGGGSIAGIVVGDKSTNNGTNEKKNDRNNNEDTLVSGRSDTAASETNVASEASLSGDDYYCEDEEHDIHEKYSKYEKYDEHDDKGYDKDEKNDPYERSVKGMIRA